jgi:hypothetical protein
MVSARVLVYGAVVAAGLAFLSPSGSACDNRYPKSCAPRVAPAVETNQATKVAKSKVRTVKRKAARTAKSASNARRKVAQQRRASAKRKAAVRSQAKWKSAKQADRRRSARAAVQQRRKVDAASASTPSLTSESAIQRRFRGFIGPKPMSTNVFEVMRQPRLDSSHMAPAVAVAAAVTDVAMVAPSIEESAPSVVAQGAEVETTGSAGYQLASAGEVVVSEPPIVKPASVIEMAAPVEKPSDSLPLRELFLALCGALTAAGAVRFVVGA